jgi:hypothetical protein
MGLYIKKNFQLVLKQNYLIAAQNKLHIREARQKYNNIGAECAEQMFLEQ